MFTFFSFFFSFLYRMLKRRKRTYLFASAGCWCCLLPCREIMCGRRPPAAIPSRSVSFASWSSDGLRYYVVKNRLLSGTQSVKRIFLFKKTKKKRLRVCNWSKCIKNFWKQTTIWSINKKSYFKCKFWLLILIVTWFSIILFRNIKKYWVHSYILFLYSWKISFIRIPKKPDTQFLLIILHTVFIFLYISL